MAARPALWTRVAATLAGEVSAETLEPYRRAGTAALELLVEAEERRAELVAEGVSLWSADGGTKAFLVAAWNASSLQTLGEEFVEADYRANPSTVGFVPPVTARQALAFYDEVEQWVSRARQAQANPKHRLDVRVPAPLPAWVDVEPCPPEHVDAMLAACRHLCGHAELAVADAERGAPPEHRDDVARLRADLASAMTGERYALDLKAGKVDARLHERIEQSAKRAVEAAFRVGQLAAMPELVDALPPPPQRLPGPGEPGFDPWCLTSPSSRALWKRDPRARAALDLLWSSDPDPARTLAVQAELDAALAGGEIAYATDRQGRRLGNFYCCPWAPIYVAAADVTLDGRRIARGQQFTLDVSAEELLEGGRFKRELLLGDFSPTDGVDYCDGFGDDD